MDVQDRLWTTSWTLHMRASADLDDELAECANAVDVAAGEMDMIAGFLRRLTVGVFAEVCADADHETCTRCSMNNADHNGCLVTVAMRSLGIDEHGKDVTYE